MKYWLRILKLDLEAFCPLILWNVVCLYMKQAENHPEQHSEVHHR